MKQLLSSMLTNQYKWWATRCSLRTAVSFCLVFLIILHHTWPLEAMLSLRTKHLRQLQWVVHMFNDSVRTTVWNPALKWCQFSWRQLGRVELEALFWASNRVALHESQLKNTYWSNAGAFCSPSVHPLTETSCFSSCVLSPKNASSDWQSVASSPCRCAWQQLEK